MTKTEIARINHELKRLRAVAAALEERPAQLIADLPDNDPALAHSSHEPRDRVIR